MKKLIKLILTAAGLAVLLDTANKAIFALAKHAAGGSSKNEHIYKWKFGKIRYVVAGDAALPPLLLVHGIGAGAGLHEWEALIPALSKRYRVYALDLLGFGKSEMPDVTVSSYLYALLIRDFMKNVIGVSAFVASNNLSCSFVAVAAKLAPAYFDKLLFLAPNAVQQVKPTCKQRLVKMLLECPIVGTSAYLAMTSRCAFRAKMEQLGLRRAEPFYIAAHQGGAAARFPYAAILTGSLYANTAHILRNTPQACRILWPESTHPLPQMQDPQALFRACREFFGA